MNECYAGDVSLVQSVTPDSVKYMESCYEGCINLKEGNIPVMVKDIESAWAGCSSLEKVTGKIPKGCEGEEDAFEGCRML